MWWRLCTWPVALVSYSYSIDLDIALSSIDLRSVHLSVEELADVGHGGGAPGVHGAVHQVEVRDPVAAVDMFTQLGVVGATCSG